MKFEHLSGFSVHIKVCKLLENQEHSTRIYDYYLFSFDFCSFYNLIGFENMFYIIICFMWILLSMAVYSMCSVIT